MQEIWKVIEESDKFEISSNGRIRSTKTNKILKTYFNKRGYEVIVIKPFGRIGKCYCLKIHRLVAQAFIPNFDGKPQINHIDTNKSNNSIDNLEWVTNRENLDHAIKYNLRVKIEGNRNGRSKLTNEDVCYIRSIFIPKDKNFGITGLAKTFNVHYSVISTIVNNKAWIHVKCN